MIVNRLWRRSLASQLRRSTIAGQKTCALGRGVFANWQGVYGGQPRHELYCRCQQFEARQVCEMRSLNEF